MRTYRGVFFCVIFVIIALIVNNGVKGANTFIAKRFDEVVCVTNGSNAITWTASYVTESSSFATASVLVPESDFLKTNPYFNCDFTLQEQQRLEYWNYTSIWRYTNSVEGLIRGPIFDYRWERLPKIYTQHVSGARGKPLIFREVAVIQRKDFRIPISIRTQNEAHLFICDGREPSSSNCYWLLLTAFSGTKSGVRKCPANYIKAGHDEYPDAPCKKVWAEVKHTGKESWYFSKDEWKHYELEKEDRTITFSHWTETGKTEILKYTDEEEDATFSTISTFHLIAHSKNVDGEWKFHNYAYIYTNKKASANLGPKLGVPSPDSWLCISMLVAMCSSCTLELSVLSQKTSSIIGKQKFQNEHTGWKEIKFVVRVPQQVEMYLVVTTESQSSDSEIFWAIGYPRLCQQQEFRVIRLRQDDVSCQVMSYANQILWITSPTTYPRSTCPTNSIGESCAPCLGIFSDVTTSNTCGVVKICQDTLGSGTTCSCSAGYSGEYCSQGCPYNFYGHGCKEVCGECADRNQCGPVDGSCPVCAKNFTGPKCDIPPGLFFKYPPQLVDNSADSCTIEVTNFEIEHIIKDKSVTGYSIQYIANSPTTDDNIQWRHFGGVQKLDEPMKFVIDQLNASTSYLIRAILTTENTFEESDFVKAVQCTTKCLEIQEDEIKSIVTSNTLEINFESRPGACKMSSYRILFDGRQAQLKERRGENTIIFENLQPYTEYNVTIVSSSTTFKITKIIRTMESAPSIVSKFEVLGVSSTVIDVKWEEPQAPNGKIRGYTVEYQIQYFKSCQTVAHSTAKDKVSPSGPKVLFNTSDLSYKIEGLKPYSKYSISIFAFNTVNGESLKEEVETPPADSIYKTEVPAISEVKPHARTADIVLDSVDCTNIRGPLMIKFNGKCSNEWCKRNVSSSLDYFKNTFVVITGIYPYSNYSLTMDVCRNDTFCTPADKSIQFRSNYTVPNQVTGLLAYSKGNNFISIRWKPPYPPTGELKAYYIEYAYSTAFGTFRYDKVVTVSDARCLLWSDYQCFKIKDNVFKGLTYNVKVYARNEDPPAYSSRVDQDVIQVVAKKEEPDPPSNVTFLWSDNNDLQITWNHPDVTNGDVVGFFVLVRLGRGSTKLMVEDFMPLTQDEYKLTYTFNVTEQLQPSSFYRAIIISFNDMNSTRAGVASDTSPPPITFLEKDPVVLVSNETVSLEISPSSYDPICEKFVTLLQNTAGNITNQTRSEMLKTVEKWYNQRFTGPEIIQYTNFTTIKHSFNVTLDEETALLVLSEKSYTMTVIVINAYGGKFRWKTYILVRETSGGTTDTKKREPRNSNTGLFALFLLLLLIPVIAIIYLKRRKMSTYVDSWKVSSLSTMLNSNSHYDNEEDRAHFVGSLDNKGNVPLKPLPKTRTKVPASENNLLDEETNAVTHSKLIKILNFEQYVKDSIHNGELERQHALFPRGQTQSWDYGVQKANKSKNRYNNLIAYDHSRVVLAKIGGDQYSDYINANYIDGYKIPKAYIATQGPKEATLKDFWRMIWQENVEYIVMLANIYENGKKKVEKYWPDINEQFQFDDITVSQVANEVFADYEYRVFNANTKEEQRKVYQLHFSTWPDHGVPLYSQSLVPFLQRILKIPLSTRSPVVVHCSAGVGRTGTVLLCDISLRRAAREGNIDLLNTIQHLREQRANMVDNIEQYKLAHLVILECLLGKQTSLPCSEIDNAVRNIFKTDEIKQQLRYLKDTAWQDQAMKTVGQTDHTAPVVAEKNRFQNILPEIQGRVFLQRYPPKDEDSSYINAIKVDGFRCPGRFIVTQQPLPNTLGDFWRLVEIYNISVVLSLNEINMEDKTSCNFYPTQGEQKLKPVDYITLQHESTVSQDCYDLISLRFMTKNIHENKIVQVVSMKNWPASKKLPRSTEEIITFWEGTNPLFRTPNPILVTCYDGATASGVYLALSFLIEKMKLEQTCDVCQAVRTIRHNREQFIDEEQFAFLYKVAVQYISGFQSYSNFN